ncbi:ATP-binding cassette sub-family B member 7, mitochondrial, partial [Dictyocoela roeselum]
ANPPCAGKLNKSLELKGVSIYHKERKILSNISFRINRGDKVAIIGKNGAGKSTIVKAIMGFVDYEGVIRIDDLDVVGSYRKIPNESSDSGGGSFQVKEILENSTPDEVVLDVSKTPSDKREASSISKVSKIKHSSLRNLISYGSQKGCIWDNTVMYNLKYGNTKKESEILRVCKLFRFHDDFIRLPYGYFTRTGEMGKLLSGGEIQKIILVRSFVNDLPVVILDEPFSNLDDKSTKNAINAIFREFTDKTVIIVIHDLEYLHLFGKVLVVEDGQVSVRENMN